MDKNLKQDIKVIVGTIVGIAASAAGFIALAYVRSGRRDQKTPLLPERLKHQIDKLVFWLDSRYGKVWVERGMDALQAGLSGTAPDLLVKLLEPVFHAEVLGRRKHWSGMEKLNHAVSSLGKN